MTIVPYLFDVYWNMKRRTKNRIAPFCPSRIFFGLCAPCWARGVFKDFLDSHAHGRTRCTFKDSISIYLEDRDQMVAVREANVSQKLGLNRIKAGHATRCFIGCFDRPFKGDLQSSSSFCHFLQLLFSVLSGFSSPLCQFIAF